MKLSSKKIVGRRHVFDLSVPETENFLADGLVVHNCTSHGMRKMIQRIRPDCFEDVAACGALYRPGPLGSGMDKLYAVNKQKAIDGELKFEHPVLKEILEKTYNCYIYQENVLELGRKLGNLSWTDVNRLRKLFLKRTKDAAGKRDSEGEELKGKLLTGFEGHGFSRQWGEDQWEALQKWSSYGFNRAHALAYGMVTMQTAYLRTYYPLEFFAAVLSQGQAGDLQTYVNEIRRQGIRILPVDVNRSGTTHRIEGDGIRLALTSIKGAGGSAVQKVVANQPYVSLLDFMLRSGANRKVAEGLIKVQAFDELEPTVSVKTQVARYELVFDNPKYKQKKWQPELERVYPDVTGGKDDPIELMQWERDFLEFNLRNSPFTINDRDRKVELLISEGVAVDIRDLLDEENEHYTDEVCCIPLAVKDIRTRPQKNGQQFAFLKLTDRHGHEIEAPCFGNIWSHVSQSVVKGNVYLIVLHRKDGEPSNFVVGKPGWKHSQKDAKGYVLPLDELQL